MALDSDKKLKPGMLSGVRVLELGDETAEFCGLLLAGMGAEVVKIEPGSGAPSRRIGPFLNSTKHPDESLHFWSYNRGKKSVQLDLDTVDGQNCFARLCKSADVVLSTKGAEPEKFLGLSRLDDTVIDARLSPFGEEGPWKDFTGSDLIHLALGGVMMNCGYDPRPDGTYDLPPIAPQLWHAYHIAGEQLAVGILAALVSRSRSGSGQVVTCSIHEAVSKNTELDLMSWVMRRAPLNRLTARHSLEQPNRISNIAYTKDGRWCMVALIGPKDTEKVRSFLESYGFELTGASEAASEGEKRNIPGSGAVSDAVESALDAIQKFVRSFTYDELPWAEAQEAGLLWAPVRKPHENVDDPHWLERKTFQEIWHPELGTSFMYPTSKWISDATDWQPGRRAPLLGEDTTEVLDNWHKAVPATPRQSISGDQPVQSRWGKPFALQGVRIFDFSWFLASAGGTRILTSLGAECLKVEWKAHPDTRMAAMAPIGGRDARRRATGPLAGVNDSDMGGQFNNKNPGKRGLSLNIRDPRGLDIAKRLIAMSDIVAEGFSPGVLDRMGLDYSELKRLRPDIIYVQQSGMGSHGRYGRFRTVGPIAASFTGATEMSGLAEPALPAGWGYSYLDWIGAYGFALAALGALRHRDMTGEGQWIDSSQCEAGIFQAAVPVLDWQANGKVWSRYGNRSPYKPAAPHGAYKCRDSDRWIAIACFEDVHWKRLTEVLGARDLLEDERFTNLQARVQNQDDLDEAVTQRTLAHDAYALMEKLQNAGVPSGVCQTAQDRCDNDPQLDALHWLTEVKGTKIGTWPVIEFPAKLSETPAFSGGMIDRGAPCYGEDTDFILQEMLKFSSREIARLREDEVI